ncbi:hypothetical protein LXA43DRAFT_956410 [Ganoderma leucocontextum]|nr:hypothetical protein LXA43DRAFT_956410 [Ganoderma leucocontextum]
MPSPEYSRLLASPQASESENVQLLTLEDSGWHSTGPTTRAKPAWLSESTAWKVLVLSSVLSLAISAANLTFLSTWATLSSRYGGSAATTSPPLEYPNVYIGLERVARDPSRCLSRGTYPDTFSTYDVREGTRATLRHVHAPEDEATLAFGGPIRTVVEAYVPDYGLENCTFIVHSSSTEHLGQGRSVDVYLLSNSKPGGGQDGTFLDRLAFVPGKDSMSRPFHCPSRSRIRLELHCGEEDCMVKIPLKGLTSKTAEPASVSRTGFRINQYEAVDCIARSRGSSGVGREMGT